MTERHKACVCVGGGREGKGVILDLLPKTDWLRCDALVSDVSSTLEVPYIIKVLYVYILYFALLDALIFTQYLLHSFLGNVLFSKLLFMISSLWYLYPTHSIYSKTALGMFPPEHPSTTVTSSSVSVTHHTPQRGVPCASPTHLQGLGSYGRTVRSTSPFPPPAGGDT